MSYTWYKRALQDSYRELKLPAISTHGLRHSTSELYMHHGAGTDDIRQLLAHASASTTERYIHNRGSHLEQVASSLKLFPDETNRPQIDHAAVFVGIERRDWIN